MDAQLEEEERRTAALEQVRLRLTDLGQDIDLVLCLGL